MTEGKLHTPMAQSYPVTALVAHRHGCDIHDSPGNVNCQRTNNVTRAKFQACLSKKIPLLMSIETVIHSFYVDDWWQHIITMKSAYHQWDVHMLIAIMLGTSLVCCVITLIPGFLFCDLGMSSVSCLCTIAVMFASMWHQCVIQVTSVCHWCDIQEDNHHIQ